MRLWHALVQLHRDIEARPWGAVLLGNVWPAYVFALPLATRILALPQLLPLATSPSLNDRARFLQELVTIFFLALVVLLFAIRRRGVRGRRATWREGLVALVATFLLSVVGYLPIAADASTGSLLASSAVVVLGTLFTSWSLLVLGRCFGLLPEVRGLVTRGPYRWVRHPVYLGELVSGLGIVIAKPHPLVLAIYATFVVLQYLRTVFEERALAAAFPTEYPVYRARVPRLVPGWR